MDIQKAHQHFSADCFNGVWTLLEKADRSVDDDELMRQMAHASLFHWLKREDCSDQNLSIGYWQISRVYSVLGEAEQARIYGQRCLDVSGEQPPFFVAYAHEALSRAAKVAGDGEALARHCEEAKSLAEKVEDKGEQSALLDDLAELMPSSLQDGN